MASQVLNDCLGDALKGRNRGDQTVTTRHELLDISLDIISHGPYSMGSYP